MKSTALLAGVIGIAAAFGTAALSGSGGPPIGIPARAGGAGKVVVATALSVTPQWRTNAFGDQLIVSLVGLRVEETLKGIAGNFEWLDLEGGTVDGITLRVSSLPELKPGERAVFFLDATKDGSNVPHLRGKGILKLDKSNHVADEGLSLDDIRRMVHQAGK